MIKNINSNTAWKILSEQQDSALIDVRTEEECIFTGIPHLETINKQVHCISIMFYPEMKLNQNFINSVQSIFSNKSTKLLFICRSGHRSSQAALSAFNAGYESCYNVSDGFEGQVDNNRHRNNINGWKFNNLPWIQN